MRTRLACWVSGLLGLMFFALSFSGPLLLRILRVDYGSRGDLPALTEADLMHLMRLYAILFMLVVAALLIVPRLHLRVPSSPKAKLAIFTVSFSGLLFLLLTRLESEASWYPLKQILTAPQTLDVFGRRLLLVWPAQWIYGHIPGISPLRAFYLVQAAVILATMLVVARWSARFVGTDNAYLGQLLLIVMLAPTLTYYDFFDIAIILIYTLALLALWDRRYIFFVLLVGIGALNHENTLLLAFVAVAVSYGREKPRRSVAVAGSAVAAWLLARLLIMAAVPVTSPFQIRVITNLWELLHDPRAIGTSVVTLLPMFLFTVWGWKSAPQMLRRSAFLLLPLFGVTYVFGKFREPRQFDAFIPLAIGFALSALRLGFRGAGLTDSDVSVTGANTALAGASTFAGSAIGRSD
ncbi:MAG: hypothetical protein WB579_00690 [Bryobacteraceae bacterium]